MKDVLYNIYLILELKYVNETNKIKRIHAKMLLDYGCKISIR